MFVHSRIISNVRQTDVDLEVESNRVITGVHAKMDYMQNVCPGTGWDIRMKFIFIFLIIAWISDTQ